MNLFELNINEDVDVDGSYGDLGVIPDAPGQPRLITSGFMKKGNFSKTDKSLFKETVLKMQESSPMWDITKGKFTGADSGYIDAQSDITPELKALGKDKKAIQKWIDKNNGDFGIKG